MKRGFTLLELLVVVGVVAILTTASMVIINPSEQLQKSRDAQRKQDLRQLQTALQAYYEDNGRFPLASGQQISVASWGNEWRPYMAKVPKDPISTPNYLYETDVNGTYYRVYAKLEHCPDSQMIPQADCADYNYAVTSSNIVAAVFGTPTPTPIPVPTLTPTPTPTFKTVFVTSTSYTGANFGGLAGSNNTCKTVADGPSSLVQGKTWTAWLSDSVVTNAKDRVYPPGAGKENTGYKLVDGTIVANNKAELISGKLITGTFINRDEANNVIDPPLEVWTGTNSSGVCADGCNSSATCVAWSATFSTGQFGNTTSPSGGWTDSGQFSCRLLHRLYCFEQ